MERGKNKVIIEVPQKRDVDEKKFYARKIAAPLNISLNNATIVVYEDPNGNLIIELGVHDDVKLTNCVIEDVGPNGTRVYTLKGK